MSRLWFCGVVFALIVPAIAQQELFRVEGTFSSEFLGVSGVVPIGDIDGDGIEDLVGGSDRLVVSPGASSYVRAYSGALGQAIWTTYAPGFLRLDSIRGGGDVNGDGVQDLLVGAPNFTQAQVPVGAIYVLSGDTGAVIRTHIGLGGGHSSRTAGPIVGDTNGDGFDDYVISDQQYGGFSGPAYLHSGDDGRVLHVLVNNATLRPYWASALGDVDQDGFDDVLITKGGCNGTAICPGFLTAYSGRTGQELYTVQGDHQETGLGLTGERCGGEDLNGDGVPDFVGAGDVFNASANQNRGMVRAYSGVDGATLWTRIGDTPQDRLGNNLTLGDDWNGDGVPDVLATYNTTVLNLRVMSGSDGATIAEFPSRLGYSFGATLHPGPDLDGDGVRDPLMRGQITRFPFPLPNNGAILAMKIANGPGAFRRHHGRACPASNGYLPHLLLNKDPRLGATADVRLRGTKPDTVAGLMVGFTIPGGIDMSPFGAAGCTLYTSPFWYAPLTCTDADGLASTDVPVPDLLALTGVRLESQWFLADVAANPAGVILSTAVSMMLGP